MKRTILIISIIFSVTVFSGCTKVVVAPDNPFAGSWVLSDASQNNGYGWQHFSTGLETGVFDLYNNGGARYDDGRNLMTGSWYSSGVTTGYYDQYGNYYTDLHQNFEISVRDSYSGSSIDLYFDDVTFYGGSMIATNYTGGYIERYIFNRY